MANVYEIVTGQIVKQLQDGTVPWRQPWSAGAGMPMSMSTGKPYRGVNVFLLGSTPHTSQWWGTYKKIEELGGQVRKGEKSSIAVFWRIVERDDADGTTKEVPILRYYRVFNADQAEGLPERFYAKPENDHEPLAECESIVQGYVDGPSIMSDGGGRAYYVPSEDAIHHPQMDTFIDAEHFYSTLFHELGHSTGHTSRLDRFKGGMAFGCDNYSREELIAEMTAAMLCGIAGILPTTLQESSNYVASWIKVLRGDERLVVAAAGAAQRAADRILGKPSNDEIANGKIRLAIGVD